MVTDMEAGGMPCRRAKPSTASGLRKDRRTGADLNVVNPAGAARMRREIGGWG